jgi:hypothetical protein
MIVLSQTVRYRERDGVRASLLMLAGASAAVLLGDSAYGYLATRGSYYLGNPIEITYALHGGLIIAAAAVAPSSFPTKPATPGFFGRGFATVFAVTSGAAVVVLAAYEVVRSLLADHDVSGVVITTRDVTERVELESTLADLALHDPLTGLPNRASFIDRVDQVLAARARDGLLVAVMFCDLDQFKTINDTLGQAVGDDVLRAAAERLRGAARPGDTVARSEVTSSPCWWPPLVRRSKPKRSPPASSPLFPSP